MNYRDVLCNQFILSKTLSGASALENEKSIHCQEQPDTAAIGPFCLLSMRFDGAVSHVRSAVDQRRRLNIAICNAHTLLTAFDDAEYANVLQSMTLLNDGIGVNIANNLLNGNSFPDNLNGTDFVPYMLQTIGVPLRIYLFGAHDAQLAGACAAIRERYPDHIIVGQRSGYFEAGEVPAICRDISEAKPDLLLVAMGNPRQERFIMEHQDSLDVPVAIGVGALFDFMSGSVARAPKVLQVLGLEWLFRLALEPRRLFRRYIIGIPRFLFAIFKLRFKRRGEAARQSL